MESGISFGELEQSQPEKGLRPDQDKHFAVAECGGELRPNDLPIFVDLDVMRDMEAHARTNTRVELGGVMLGKQLIDDEGKPFVVISDSLRANHYEATKGSFKFTHETWNQITRDRNEFRPDLEMVGWYHTHPGWGVFLSGMDLFICNNFFNRPLDVALVVEPVANERGWFQWDEKNPQQTRETPGFLLMTSRYRKSELNYFTNLYSSDSHVGADPRYSQPSFSQSGMPEAEEVVHIHDNRRPVFDFAILAMIFMQFILTGLIAWRMVAPESFADNDKADKAEVEKTIRMKTYEEVLGAMVDGESRQQGMLNQFAEIAEKNDQLSQSLEGQQARAVLASRERDSLATKLTKKKKDVGDLVAKLATRNSELSDSQSKVEMLNAELEIDTEDFFYKWKTLLMWLGGLALAGVAALSGFFLGQRRRDDDGYGYGDDSRAPEGEDRLGQDRDSEPENFDERSADVRIADVTITDDANAVKSATLDSSNVDSADVKTSGDKPKSNKQNSSE